MENSDLAPHMGVHCLSKLLQPSALLTPSHSGAPTQRQVGWGWELPCTLPQAGPPSWGQKIEDYYPK